MAAFAKWPRATEEQEIVKEHGLAAVECLSSVHSQLMAAIRMVVDVDDLHQRFNDDVSFIFHKVGPWKEK